MSVTSTFSVVVVQTTVVAKCGHGFLSIQGGGIDIIWVLQHGKMGH